MQPKSGHIELSVIIPTFNEEGNIALLIQRLEATMTGMGCTSYEYVFIDDGSTDQSLENIKQARLENKQVQYLQFSKNFGHQHALKAGLDHARGAAVVSLDADLQHPPELIAQMYALWKNGAELVYTRRQDESSTGFFKRKSAKDVSKSTHFIIVLGALIWMLYGFEIQSFPIIISNFVGILTNGIILWTCFTYK
jgi:dolichol-phosphate mannosyltransferase